MHKLNWDKFIQATKSRKPVGFLMGAVEKIKSPNKLALDLGCGAGIDAKYLAENKFQVEAVDYNQDSIDQTKKLCEDLSVNVIKSNIIDYKIKPNNYQIIISWNTLPFLKKRRCSKNFT
jgi:2-polyprenyl-3-methyl-5-hydroxy-6-metoxy-1,4-benzoquinol methylase